MKLKELFTDQYIDKTSLVIKYCAIVFIIVFLILFYFFIPFGYKLVPVEGMEFYQYQTINKDDLKLYEIKLRGPWDNGFDTVEDFTINYGDYKELTTEEYIKKYNTTNEHSVGEQVVLANENGRITFTVNRKSATQDLDIIKATKAELGYEGVANIGDILDLEKIYLDVEYENGDKMQYTINQFEIVDTDDLVLKRGYNNFTVRYAGEKFLLSVLCEA